MTKRWLAKLVLAVACVAMLTASKCIGDTPVEVCLMHPTYGAVCVKVNGQKYDLNRPDLTEAQLKEVKEWVASQPK